MVYLAGAGTGGEELITLRGMECIKSADIIIFDRLVNLSLLNYAPDGCRFIYAGKESGNHTLPQEEINALLLKCAREAENVVRLKGGDPFVFGRGGEEAQILRENGIPFEVVPGVSSCFAAAEYAGIPVTHRSAASSFHVITGHEKNEHADYSVLAREEGTLVFLMGLKNLPAIAEKLIKNGKSPASPAAVISRGTLKNQQCVIGTLGNIAKLTRELSPPAVTVIGDAVLERAEWFKCSGPLKNVKIVSVAARDTAENLARETAKQGGELTRVSLIKTVPLHLAELPDFSAYTHMVFTSAAGADCFFELLGSKKTDVRTLYGKKIAAVGPKTAEHLAKYGIFADLVPEHYDSKSLAALLREDMHGGAALLIRAENASKALNEALDGVGIKYADFPVYRTEINREKGDILRLAVKDADYVIFSSSSAAEAFCEILKDDVRGDIKYISVGAQTTTAAEALGLRIHKTAKNADAKSVIECISEDVKALR